MSVNQVLRKLGAWSIKLRPDAPPGIIGALDYFGHVAVVPGRLSPVERGDELLTLARYVGILRDIDTDTQVTLSGVSINAWLGDEDGKGDVIEAPGITLTGATFAASIRALLPAGGAITEGTLTAIAGTYTATHTYQTPRTAIDYVCDLFDGEWKVNGDGTLDAGPPSALFRTTPECLIVRRGAGYDGPLKALPGTLKSTRSAKDYTSRVVVVGNNLATGSADAGSIPYKDLHGNDVVWTRVVDEQDDTAGANAAARAQGVLNLFSGTRRSVRLSVSEFDVAGDFEPGDVVWVYDPEADLADTAYEVAFRGELLNPMPVRVLALTWPVTQGYTVGYRDSNGAWTDLTPWVDWESAGGGEVEVADSLSSALTPGVGTIGTAVSGSTGDTSVPGVPVFGAFTTTSYQPGDGLAQAQIKVTWTQPLNVDASTITDGDHYEIRYRPTGASDWQVTYAGWDTTAVMIQGLSPSTTYEFQIRAVDYASPINYGAWSATTSQLSATDTTPPATPAPPTVAASLIAVQVTHTLGLASGGTYNLPLDMDHLDVHVGTTSGFTPSAASLVGKLLANGAMVTGAIPAVGTFQVDTIVGAGAAAYVKVVAVDKTGNASTASSAASATATLIDAAHITSLTASQITAGTLSAAYTLSGSIKTGASGARVELDTSGVRLYNSGGTATVDLNTSTGTGTLTGKVQTGTTGSRVIVDPASTDIKMYPSSGSAYASITGVGTDITGATPAATSAWLDLRSSPGTSDSYSNLLLSSATSGDVRARVLLTARQADGHTSSWIDLVDRATDTDKYASIGVGAEAGYTMGSMIVSKNVVKLESYNGAELQANLGNAYVTAFGSGYAELGNGDGAKVSVNVKDATVYALSTGNASIQNADGSYFSSNGTKNYVYSSSTFELDASNVNLATSGASLDISSTTVTAGGTAFKAQAVYNVTTGFSPNVYVHSTWQMYNTSSTARIKSLIAPAQATLEQVLALEPVTYYDRRQYEQEAGGDVALCSPQIGLLAEQVAEVDGIGERLIERGEDGAPRSINYERVSVVALLAIRDLAERVAKLEGGRVPKRAGIPQRILALSDEPYPEPVPIPVPQRDRPGMRRNKPPRKALAPE